MDTPFDSIQHHWRRAGSETLTEEEAVALLALDLPEVTISLAMNSATPAVVLQRIYDQGGAAAESALTNRNSPPHLKELAPLGSHTDESVWLYAKAQGATDSQRRALLKALDECPRPGGPLLRDAWRDILSEHPDA